METVTKLAGIALPSSQLEPAGTRAVTRPEEESEWPVKGLLATPPDLGAELNSYPNRFDLSATAVSADNAPTPQTEDVAELTADVRFLIYGAGASVRAPRTFKGVTVSAAYGGANRRVEPSSDVVV